MARHADRIISESPKVRAAIDAVLEACGITDDLLAKRVAEGVDATVFLRPTLHDRERVLVDFRERREMVELACRLKGHLTEKHHVRVGKTLEEILDEANHAAVRRVSCFFARDAEVFGGALYRCITNMRARRDRYKIQAKDPKVGAQ